MTRDDIIRMAKEAWDSDVDPWLTHEQRFLERFAALVAAAEREACLEIVEKRALVDATKEQQQGYRTARDNIAAAIRARSNT